MIPVCYSFMMQMYFIWCNKNRCTFQTGCLYCKALL